MPLSQSDSSEKRKAAKPGKKAPGGHKTGTVGSNKQGEGNDLAPNAIPALRNFIIGLAVCTLVIIGAVIAFINRDSLMHTFVNASQGVSGLVPEEKPKPVQMPVVLEPPPPPKDELYGDDPSERFQLKKNASDEKRPPARRQRVRIE